MDNQSAADKVFTGSIPSLYERHLVPLIFEPYARELATRLAAHPVQQVLEVAAGTGVVTRALASRLPEPVLIVATDFNQAMLDEAATVPIDRPVAWRRADAMSLPFPDQTFDAVVCQFGVMFFSDKRLAFSEARRVLRSGGLLLFAVWDRIAENEFADVVTTALGRFFPDDPPRFLPRTPYGYHDREQIARDLAAGGFASPPRIATLAERSRAASPDVPAVAFCQGTPLRNEIEARAASRLVEATEHATRAIAERFGPGPVDGQIQAHILAVNS